MKDHYDFSDAVQGKYYRPVEELDIPIYLDEGVRRKLSIIAKTSGQDMSSLANAMLDKEPDIIEMAGSQKL
jgi:hypothetical protein